MYLIQTFKVGRQAAWLHQSSTKHIINWLQQLKEPLDTLYSFFRHVLRQEEQVPSCLWPGVEARALHWWCAGVPCDMGQPAVCCQPKVHRHHPGSERWRSLPGTPNHQGWGRSPFHLDHTWRLFIVSKSFWAAASDSIALHMHCMPG